jgi:putative hydrolase of the HAD superfamily
MKAILFDFDGVLTTDATGSASICNYVASQTKIDLDVFEEEYYKYNDDLLYGRTTHDAIWSGLCGNLNTEININVLYDSFIKTPIDGQMVSIAESLKEHYYKIGMITDNKKDRIENIVNYYGWETLFDVITVSADVGSGKDNEKIFSQTLKALNLNADECVFIDNQEKNLIIPKTMKMHVIYFDHVKRDFEELTHALKKAGVKI